MQAKLTIKRGFHTLAELTGNVGSLTLQELLEIERAINDKVPTVRCHAELVQDLPEQPTRTTFVTNPKQ